MDEAKAWLDEVQAAESDGPGAAGTVAMLIEPDPATADDEIRLDFTNPVPLVRADARCFGGGTADVTVIAYSADGDESAQFSAEVPCDRDVHGIDLGSTPAGAAAVRALGSMRTYLHVTVIQEMVIER